MTVARWLTFLLPSWCGWSLIDTHTHSNFKSLTGLQQESTHSHCGIARHSTAIVRFLPQGTMEINKQAHQLNRFTEYPHKLKTVQSVFCVNKITPNKKAEVQLWRN